MHFYCFCHVRTFFTQDKDISAHGKYSYNRISAHDMDKDNLSRETYMDISVNDKYKDVYADDR